jgi:hypothetical protein
MQSISPDFIDIIKSVVSFQAPFGKQIKPIIVICPAIKTEL